MTDCRVWRSASLSRRWSRHALSRLAALAAAALMLGVISLCLGRYSITPLQLLALPFDPDPLGHRFVVEMLRLPRLLLACLVGGALALSGLLLQTLVRNPLASPDILGISQGASAAAVIFLALLSDRYSLLGLPLAAILGAWLTALLTYLLAQRRGLSPQRLVLVGIGLSALMGAVTLFTLLASPATTTLSAQVWLTGSVFGASWSDVRAMALCWLALLPALAWQARRADVLALDAPLAQALGLAVARQRQWLLALAVALAGAAVAYAGPVSFVGLIAPHLARRLVPGGFATQAAATALTGAMLVMLADLAGRMLWAPLDLPAGIFVSMIGAPFFIYLLIRQARPRA